MQNFQKDETLSCKKNSKWTVDMQFLPVKLVFFCWFSGAMSLIAFLPVFLKSQGLSISHLSLFFGISAFFQFSGTIAAGCISDKIGRIKPFWFIFCGINCLSCFCFTTLPRVDECKVENAIFECYKEEMLHINATSCHIHLNNSQEVLCSEIFVINGKIPLYLNDTSKFVVTLFPEFSLEAEKLKNISIIFSTVSDCKNCSLKIDKPCTKNSCKPLQIDCLVHFVNCNKNAKFWINIYGILVVFSEFSRTTTFRFNEIIASGLAMKSNADFGRQRLFGIFGAMVGPPLVGFILTKINGPNSVEKSYSWGFYCIIIFSVLSACSMGIVQPKFHKPASKMGKNSFALMKNVDIILFFALMIVMGSVLGFQLNYRNWYLKELGASDLLTGIVSGSTNLYGIPFLFISSWFINKIGYRNMFVLGLFGHAVCSFSYSVLRDPWIAVILESTAIVSYHLFWIAALQYAHLVAPEGLEALTKALTGSLHYNIGNLGSSLIAGYVMKIYGGSVAYAVLGSIALAYSFVYIFYIIVLYWRQKKTETQLGIVAEKKV